ncbi:motile sperm domain-containing protein 2-like [Daphnia pulex]|uniref:Motile sperm domain-containing protein 2 n=2 Tax=Daphnia TaxID=6668 RepID=E9HJL8_DAPPU|nr:motile sperm domain-containing protein 2-like [Daphnia pulex]XP_046653429.1 motile sperm domain-containing protein 2-like isoform X1 [Daphnia pulicaria]EFX68040.1 hypothetical protein DAPPUDRAFT_229022 [Daphnia pulex]|eukprot:EFX68040.1 hypothetical protein DAPPUDRAFT_229022 [Daphnia pulex]
MEPSEEDILEVRQKALEKVESPEQDIQAHPKDVDRLKNDKDWVRRFLLHHDLDKEKAVNMIIGTLKWRSKFGANDISHSNINLQIVCAGGMFPHCKDKDGKPLFIVKVKSSVKGAYKSDEVHKVLVYWFDRLEKQQKGDKISVFFEMTGAGLSNMDMEFVQYLIMLFRDYYPYFLNYIIIFEMSWILNAAWKVIKGWMPAKSVNMVKFVGRSDLKDFVPVTEQLAEWGGPVNYHFVFEPEFLPAAGPVNLNGQFDDSKKKVHFAEGTTSSETSSVDSTETVKKPVPGQYLQLTPAEEIVFRREDGETTGMLVMNNTAGCNVAYKIKTTSPDKYRVRPSAGIICTAGSLNVTVHIQSGYSASQLVRDKFLVMACTVESDSLTNLQLTEVWKKTNENTIQQHRLRCSVAPSDAKDDEFAGNALGLNNATAKLLQDIAPQLNKILDEQENLRRQLKDMRILLFVLIILSIAVPFYFFNNDSGDHLSCRV